MQVRRVSARKASAAFLTVLVLLSSIQIAYAWNPAVSDLTGTSSSTDNSVVDALRRFDIDHTTTGIQTGEDVDSLAFLIKLQPSQLLQSSPTADIPTTTTVTNPTFAYNSNPDDAATFDCTANPGSWEIVTFGTGSGTIVSVDLYVRASATQGTDDTHALSYAIGGLGETTLWAPSFDAVTLQDYSFLNLAEPNDGSWTWTDVSDLEIIWRVQKSAGPDGNVVSVYEVWLIVKGYGFAADGMTTGDQYEIDFTIGEEDFVMLFQASGAAAGTMKLFYRATGGGAWSDGETYVVGSITSGTPYQSPSDLGFTLTSSSATVGSVKLVVTKTILATLGATSNTVTGIFAANFAGGTGEAGSGGATPNDRSPETGGASWTLSEAIPDFPHGTLVLMAPVISAYLALRKRNGTGDT